MLLQLLNIAHMLTRGSRIIQNA